MMRQCEKLFFANVYARFANLCLPKEYIFKSLQELKMYEGLNRKDCPLILGTVFVCFGVILKRTVLRRLYQFTELLNRNRFREQITLTVLAIHLQKEF